MSKISGYSATELAVHFTDTKNSLAQKRMKVRYAILEFEFRLPAKDPIEIRKSEFNQNARNTCLCVRPSNVILLLALGSIALN